MADVITDEDKKDKIDEEEEHDEDGDDDHKLDPGLEDDSDHKPDPELEDDSDHKPDLGLEDDSDHKPDPPLEDVDLNGHLDNNYMDDHVPNRVMDDELVTLGSGNDDETLAASTNDTIETPSEINTQTSLIQHKIPKDFNHADFGFSMFSLILFLVDYAINLFLFQKYFQLSKYVHFSQYCWATFSFTVSIPLLVGVFEVVWYAEEKQKYGHSLKWYQWILRLTLIGLLLGPAFRFVEVMMFAHKKLDSTKDPKKRRQLVHKAMQMKADADFLYMIEKFTESALHVVLQMLIVKKELHGEERDHIGFGEAMKIISTVILMPYSITMCLRSQRQADPKANNMSMISCAIQFIWRFFIVVPQAVTLSLFCSVYPFPFMITSLVDWGLMIIWIFLQPAARVFPKHMWLDCIYRFFIGYIYLFNFLNVKKGDSYYRSLFYHCYLFLQRGLMICFWCQGESYKVWYRWIVLTIYFLFFFSGMSIQLIYYLFHHPTREHPKDVHKKLLAIDRKSNKSSSDQISIDTSLA